MRTFILRSHVTLLNGREEIRRTGVIEANDLFSALTIYKERCTEPAKIDFRIGMGEVAYCLEAFNIDHPDVVVDYIREH